MNFLDSKVREILQDAIELDSVTNPYSHTNISDLKYCALWCDLAEEAKLWKMFRLIKVAEPVERQRLINSFYTSLERKYNDQSLHPDVPHPEKVGRAVDKVVANGVNHIGRMMTGQTTAIYSWMIADQSTSEATYGDTSADIEEIARVNVITEAGFLDPMQDGWHASGGFPRSTITGSVNGAAMGNTSSPTTSQIFDRSLFNINDRITHTQNRDSFTLSAMYILTSI